MKQGTLINRIVMLLLLAAVLVYLGVSAWRSFRDPYTLVLSYAYTVDDSLEATGFLVREERVLASPGGIVDLLPEEGEKVSRGETVALLYQNASEAKAKAEAEALVKAFELAFAGREGHQVIGPAPAVIACFRGIYRFVVLIKTADLPAVHDFLKEQQLHLRADVAIDIDPITMF